MGGSSPPAAPQYVPPAAYTQPAAYSSPGAYVAPPSYIQPNLTTPQVDTASQILATGNQLEGNTGDQVPLNLQLNANNPDLPNGSAMDPAGMAQYESQYYQQLGNPAVAAAQASLGPSGQDYGSYGGALVAQTQASQDQAAYNGGLSYAQQNYNDILAGRASYYAGGPTVATNQNNAQVSATENMNSLNAQVAANENAYNLAGTQGQNSYDLASSGSQNAYNLGTAGMQNSYNASTGAGLNNYNLSNFSNQEQAYQQQQQQIANTWLGIGTLGLGLLGGGVGSGSSASALGGGLSSLLGGSNSGSSSALMPSIAPSTNLNTAATMPATAPNYASALGTNGSGTNLNGGLQ